MADTTETDAHARLHETLARYLPERAHGWTYDQQEDVLIAVDLVAATVMAEAKKNPVQAQPGFLWEPPSNRYLFGQTMHDVGQAVVDKLIGAGWVPPSRMSASKNSTPEPPPKPLKHPKWWGVGLLIALLALCTIAGALIAEAVNRG